MRGLRRLVSLAIQHIFRRPAGQGQGVLLVQAMLHERAAGDVFIHLASQHRAFGARHRGLIPGSGGGGLQRGHGIVGAQRQQAVVKAARHFGPRQAGHVTAPHQLEAALVRRLHAAEDGGVGKPVTPHLDPRGAARRFIQQSAQKLACLRRQQQRRRTGSPEFLHRAQQMGCIHHRGGFVLGVELDARKLAGPVPQRAVAENQAAEDGLDHGR